MAVSRTSRIALLASILVLAGDGAEARCACRCVDGTVQIVCTGPEIPMICPPAICPIPPPAIAPIAPPRVPPLGTETCTQHQVFDPRTGRSVWQEL
ncbi:MAG: hypothetical protein FJX67_09790 [Alphaproteobacteria bacterium]|nr:hypothetical protein [Alphaproteobacteria bacterium]